MREFLACYIMVILLGLSSLKHIPSPRAAHALIVVLLAMFAALTALLLRSAVRV
jgi:hypothetical protein